MGRQARRQVKGTMRRGTIQCGALWEQGAGQERWWGVAGYREARENGEGHWGPICGERGRIKGRSGVS